MRVALVHDWLDTWGGGEAVLAELLRVFPGADVYTLVDFLAARRTRAPRRRSCRRHRARSTIPGSRRWFRYAAVAAAGADRALRSLRLRRRRSPTRTRSRKAPVPARARCMSATATRPRASRGRWPPRTRSVPARPRAWRRPRCRVSSRALSTLGPRGVAARRSFPRQLASHRGRDLPLLWPRGPGRLSSRRCRALRASRRRARQRFAPSRLRDGVAPRPVQADRRADRGLPPAAGTPPDRRRRRTRARNASKTSLCPTSNSSARKDDAATARLVAGARAFLFAAVEDFGIAPVEAQAAGTPVIAYGRGGVRESIRGLDDRAADRCVLRRADACGRRRAVREFETATARITRCRLPRERGAIFAAARFRDEIARAVDEACAARARAVAAAA